MDKRKLNRSYTTCVLQINAIFLNTYNSPEFFNNTPHCYSNLSFYQLLIPKTLVHRTQRAYEHPRSLIVHLLDTILRSMTATFK